MPLDLIVLAPHAAIFLLLAAFIPFALEIQPPEIVAFCGAVAALAIGPVGLGDVRASPANPAPAWPTPARLISHVRVASADDRRA